MIRRLNFKAWNIQLSEGTCDELGLQRIWSSKLRWISKVADFVEDQKKISHFQETLENHGPFQNPEDSLSESLSEIFASTPRSQEDKAQALAQASYEEMRGRAKYSPQIGKVSAQSSQVMQHLLHEGADPDRVSPVQRLSQRTGSLHQPFNDDTSEWPEVMIIDDLYLENMDEEHRQQFSRHCVSFISEDSYLKVGTITALLEAHGLEVSCREKVGRTKNGQALVTVALRRVAQAREVLMSEKIQKALEYLRVLASPFRVDSPLKDVVCMRVWFLNHCHVNLSEEDLQMLAKRYGTPARVVIKQYWDSERREAITSKTRMAFQGYIQFTDRAGAEKLLLDRSEPQLNPNNNQLYQNVATADGLEVISFMPDRRSAGMQRRGSCSVSPLCVSRPSSESESQHQNEEHPFHGNPFIEGLLASCEWALGLEMSRLKSCQRIDQALSGSLFLAKVEELLRTWAAILAGIAEQSTLSQDVLDVLVRDLDFASAALIYMLSHLAEKWNQENKTRILGEIGSYLAKVEECEKQLGERCLSNTKSYAPCSCAILECKRGRKLLRKTPLALASEGTDWAQGAAILIPKSKLSEDRKVLIKKELKSVQKDLDLEKETLFNFQSLVVVDWKDQKRLEEEVRAVLWQERYGMKEQNPEEPVRSARLDLVPTKVGERQLNIDKDPDAEDLMLSGEPLQQMHDAAPAATTAPAPAAVPSHPPYSFNLDRGSINLERGGYIGGYRAKAKKQMGQVGDVKCFVEVISAPDSFRKGFQAVRYRVPGQAKVLTVKVMIGKKPEQEKKNDTAENQVSAKRRPLEEQKQKLKKNGKHKKLEEFDRNAAGRFMTRDVEEWCIQGSDGNKPAFTCPLQNKWGFDNSLEHCLSVFHRVPFETPGATGWVVFMDGAVGKGKNHGQFVPDAETRKEAEENYTSASQVLQLLDAATKNSGPDISGKAGDLLRELKKNATSWHVNAALHPTFNPEDCGEQRLNIKAIIDGHERHYHVDCQTAPHGPQNAEGYRRVETCLLQGAPRTSER
eukprot:Skav216246  [mRNA]  locus=scaffold20:50014:63313:+ [translate_table: standard]